jgi:hypothetical protein
MAKPENTYRLVVFEEPDDPQAVRDLVCGVMGIHPTDAMRLVARSPGIWPQPLAEGEVRELLDGLYEQGVPAEAWRADLLPTLSPPRTIHDAACLPTGFRVKGLRGEPTHWVPWNKIDLISAGRIETQDEFRDPSPPSWASALAVGLRALMHRPMPFPRRARAMRIPRDPIGEVYIVRREPLIAFRAFENQMTYAYLADRLRPSASENFPLFVADLVAHASRAYITESTRSFLENRESGEHLFPSSQALLDYTTHRLLWSWYRRDRDAQIATES